MKFSKGTKLKSTTSNINNRTNNKIFVTKEFFSCNTCGKTIQEHPILCYVFIKYFCNELCHDKKHKTYLENHSHSNDQIQ
ncbi:MAG: hypothetical protein K0S93_555 [Nitrososphaeraceae archaeon]|nr:hypothetical protein [Nitrososphaeraceae archaeon]